MTRECEEEQGILLILSVVVMIMGLERRLTSLYSNNTRTNYQNEMMFFSVSSTYSVFGSRIIVLRRSNA